MRKIPKSLEEKILRRLLEGATYRATKHEFSVSLATINRVVEDAREKIPDLDDLRQLNNTLKKFDLTLFDVMRAVPVLTRLEKHEVGVNELSSFIEGMNHMSKEHKVGAVELTHAMLELVELRTETGKSYWELVKDFKEKRAQVKEIEQRTEILNMEKQRLENRLGSERRELRQIVSTNERLKKLDLQKVANLTEFAENKETIEKKLHQIERDSEKKIRYMEAELKNKKTELQSLDTETRELWNESVLLLDEIFRRSKLKEILRNRKAVLPCKICWREALFLRIPNRMEVQDAIVEGHIWNFVCAFCGQQVQYTSWEILSYIGWLAL